MIREEKGQSVVEFALVIPLILLLVVGIVDIGRLTFAYSSLHFAGQESVRIAGLGGTDEEIRFRAVDSFHFENGSELQVTPSIPQDQRRSGEYITVTLTYPYIPITPFFSSLYPDGISLSTDATIRIE